MISTLACLLASSRRYYSAYEISFCPYFPSFCPPSFLDFSGGGSSFFFFAVITFHFISRAHSRRSLYFVCVRSILIFPPLKMLKLPARVTTYDGCYYVCYCVPEVLPVCYWAVDAEVFWFALVTVVLFFDVARSDAWLLEITPASCYDGHNVGGEIVPSLLFWWLVFVVEGTNETSSTDALLDAIADAAPWFYCRFWPPSADDFAAAFRFVWLLLFRFVTYLVWEAEAAEPVFSRCSTELWVVLSLAAWVVPGFVVVAVAALSYCSS